MRDFYNHVLIQGNGTDKQDNILKGKVQAYNEMSQIADFVRHFKKTN